MEFKRRDKYLCGAIGGLVSALLIKWTWQAALMGLSIGAQLGAQPRQVLIVDLFGDLATAGHFGPETGICGGRDDLGVNGRGRHAREEDGGTAGQTREGRVDDGLAVGQGYEAGAQIRPVGAGFGSPTGGGGLVTVGGGASGDNADAGALPALVLLRFRC